MILTTLPDINLYTGKESPQGANIVVPADTNTKYFYPEHSTPYLFITNSLSRGNYVLNKKHIEVSDKHFYFLNSNDHLEIKLLSAKSR